MFSSRFISAMLVRFLAVCTFVVVQCSPLFLYAQGSSTSVGTQQRMLRPSDIYRTRSVAGAQVSPDNKWVAYVLTMVDSSADKRSSDLYMVSRSGQETVRLTHTSEESERAPRWSPDGKYLSFLTVRAPEKKTQIWLLDRRGGEASKLTNFTSDLTDYAWSPDGKRIAVVLRDVHSSDTSKAKSPAPMVINRYHFKQDGEGYLWKNTKTHLFVFNMETKKLDTLTNDDVSVSSPVWSPDGKHIAFVSNRTPDPDRNQNSDLCVIEATPKASIRVLTTWTGSDSSPLWSPDGTQIAYRRSTSPDAWAMYDQSVLAVVPVRGGEPTLLTDKLDRPVARAEWKPDGKSLYIQVADNREQYVAELTIATKSLVKILSGEYSAGEMTVSSDGVPIVAVSMPTLPAEFYALEASSDKKSGSAWSLRRLTRHQDEFVAPLALASVQGFTAISKDGTPVSGLLYLPVNAPKGKALPLILDIHGGPVAQDAWGFDVTRQMLAGAGYAVAAVNYRGSSGRGLAFTKAIQADWGNKEVQDLHAAVEYLVKQGIADSARLGVGGWSYGGILTDYLIAADSRFKVATSGAGTALHLSTYGFDQYILQYENELGVPWKNMDKWIGLSKAFMNVERIKTPTLFMVGEKDFNVPTIGSEQMYQALKTLGVPTELVIYPGQFHGLSVPSYQKDRVERYIKWFNTYLMR
jgi:dipeptidyl aminopeptidase/acylaminoacyl peptidase